MEYRKKWIIVRSGFAAHNQKKEKPIKTEALYSSNCELYKLIDIVIKETKVEVFIRI
jgi:hypothetical protein